jgi:hypothetical protein
MTKLGAVARVKTVENSSTRLVTQEETLPRLRPATWGCAEKRTTMKATVADDRRHSV